VEKGLVVDENMDWKYANRVQNTITFAHYLAAIKYGLIKAIPNVFRGDLPIAHIDNIITDFLREVRFINGGWSIIKIPGKDKIFIPTNDGAELISVLTKILQTGKG